MKNAEMILTDGPFAQPVKVINCLCSDGKRRTARITGTADTFFSIPASVQVKGKTVSGFVTGSDTQDENGNWLRDFHFVANSDGKNGHLLPGFRCIDDVRFTYVDTILPETLRELMRRNDYELLNDEFIYTNEDKTRLYFADDLETRTRICDLLVEFITGNFQSHLDKYPHLSDKRDEAVTGAKDLVFKLMQRHPKYQHLLLVNITEDPIGNYMAGPSFCEDAGFLNGHINEHFAPIFCQFEADKETLLDSMVLTDLTKVTDDEEWMEAFNGGWNVSAWMDDSTFEGFYHSQEPGYWLK